MLRCLRLIIVTLAVIGLAAAQRRRPVSPSGT